jgi:ribonuclease HII
LKTEHTQSDLGVPIIICGGDEAGRGAVLGPLVISIVAIKKQNERKLADIGVRDSKLLSSAKREALFKKINKIAAEVLVHEISPKEINDAMQSKISLNELEAVHFSKLLDKVQSEFSTVYLDSPDVVQEKFGMRVNMYSQKRMIVPGHTKREKGVRYAKIIAEHKADARYPVVSAASIMAKVSRDEAIARLGDQLGVDLGSGYPSDYHTIEVVRQNMKEPAFRAHLREHWSTISNIKQARMESYF